MTFTMLCPYCKKEGKPGPKVISFKDAEDHLKDHGATTKEIEQARKSYQQEIAISNQMHREAMEACI